MNLRPSIDPGDLATAIDRDDLFLLYQPQWTADGASVVGVEALVRWNHPTHGFLPPPVFVDVAESYGLLRAMTDKLVRRACREAIAWDDVSVAVNVSPTEFSHSGLVASIPSILQTLSFPPSRFEVEIVETSVIDDYEAAASTLTDLRALGIRVALDDFGTGYSSLSLLRRLPIDKVKIDKSFIDDITSIKSASIVHAVIALARAIGLKITAEGVETAEQQSFLKIAGCHYLQGFYFSRPLPPDQVTDLLASLRPKAVTLPR